MQLKMSKQDLKKLMFSTLEISSLFGDMNDFKGTFAVGIDDGNFIVLITDAEGITQKEPKGSSKSQQPKKEQAITWSDKTPEPELPELYPYEILTEEIGMEIETKPAKPKRKSKGMFDALQAKAAAEPEAEPEAEEAEKEEEPKEEQPKRRSLFAGLNG